MVWPGGGGTEVGGGRVEDEFKEERQIHGGGTAEDKEEGWQGRRVTPVMTVSPATASGYGCGGGGARR